MNSNKQMRAHYFSMDVTVARFAAIAVLGVLALAGCSGGSSVAQNPIPAAPSVGSSYTGPAAANDDIQAFRNAFWENIRGSDRCGGCHNAAGQAPTFARSDDVNQAYQQAAGVVNRDDPSQSLIVTKVGGGHNCWRGDNSACASDLTRWIAAWVGSTGTGGRQIQLRAPDPIDPAAGKRLPALPPPEFRAVYNILDQHCSGCHQPDSATAQSPFFAAGSRLDPDPNFESSAVYIQAYQASVPKINLNTPAESRFVVRLALERHNCWTDSCANDAAALQAAITALANATPLEQTPPGLLSKALTLYDGTVASGGNRYETNMIALYEFKKGSGTVASDTSGVAPAADLELSPAPGVEWVGGWGINIRSGRARALTSSSRKLHDLITASGEYSIEAWVAPANVTQEDARIVSYSGSTETRNFTMGQNLYNYEFSGRSSATSANGAPKLTTDDDARLLQATLQHVVMTFDPINGRRIYVNGNFTGDVDGAGGGTIESWDNSFALYLGNESSGDRQWQGVIRLVAIYNRALNLQQIKQNFEAGVGEKFFLLFGVSHLIDMPQAYVMFEATQFDTYSYLFNNPKFISLDAAAMPGSIRLKGMRIGVNGAEAQVGQAYRLLDTSVSNELYSAATGQLLSSVGTVIPVEQGPDADQFFLCFDEIGSRTDACTQYTAGVTPAPVIAEASSDIGVKLFDAINATMASITNVPPNTQAVKETYESVRQSLPAVHDIKGYLSSHQTSVAQLALQYCNVLVDNLAWRNQFFTGVDFDAQLVDPAPTRAVANSEDVGAFNLVANGNTLIGVLHSKIVGTADTQLSLPEMQDAMGNLVKRLCVPQLGGETCGAPRTAEVVKAACGATLGSAATLVQ